MNRLSYAPCNMSSLTNKNNLLWSSALCDHEFGFLRLTPDSLVFESTEHIPRKVIPFSSIESTEARGIFRKRLIVFLKGNLEKIVFSVPSINIWKENLSLINHSHEYLKGKCKLDGEAGVLSLVNDSLTFQQVNSGNREVLNFREIASVNTRGLLGRHLFVESSGSAYDFRVSNARKWAEILSFALQIKTTARSVKISGVTTSAPTYSANKTSNTVPTASTPAPSNYAGKAKLSLSSTNKGPQNRANPPAHPRPSAKISVKSQRTLTGTSSPPRAVPKLNSTNAPSGMQRVGTRKNSTTGQYRGSWPMGQDYDQAFQSPGKNVNPALGNPSAWEIIRNPRNKSMLVYAAGNFGSVYKARLDDGKFYALKCFTKKSSDINTRYEKISSYLEANEGSRKFLVHFRYFKEGIKTRKSDTFYFPLLKMEWCEGDSLNNFISSNIKRPRILRSVAEALVRDVESMQNIGIAHCDLSGDNIIVNDRNEIFLVDYDGMFVPPLKGMKSMEIGHADFQHPLRTRDDYSERLDNFSTLVIYLSLLAIAEKPSLWNDFNDDNPDRLLFGKSDFKNIKNSMVCEAIKKIRDPKLSRLCTVMEEALNRPVLWDGDSPSILLSI